MNKSHRWFVVIAVVPALAVSSVATAPARLLSLDGRWFSCTIRHFGGPLWITHAAERVHGGMSGSPIIAEAPTAIGVVCTHHIAQGGRS